MCIRDRGKDGAGPILGRDGDEGEGGEAEEVLLIETELGHGLAVASDHLNARPQGPDLVGLGIIAGDVDVVVVGHPSGEAGVKVHRTELERGWVGEPTLKGGR